MKMHVFLFLFLFLLPSPFVRSYEIQGQIAIEPPFPHPKVMQVKKKREDSCASEQISQSLVVSRDGLVKNAVVWLKGDFEKPFQSETKLTMDQKSCNFSPHVLIVPANAAFDFLNSDPLAHDIRSFAEANMLFRFEMEAFAKPVEKKFDKPGIYVIRCGLHPWMHAFVVSAPHAYYAVTDEQGSFTLKDVPPGAQTLHVWHETLGETDLPLAGTELVESLRYVFSQKKN